MHFATYIPHPKPPFSQQVPLACWWLSGVFPHILLILEHKIGCFVVFRWFFTAKVDAAVFFIFTGVFNPVTIICKMDHFGRNKTGKKRNGPCFVMKRTNFYQNINLYLFYSLIRSCTSIYLPNSIANNASNIDVYVCFTAGRTILGKTDQVKSETGLVCYKMDQFLSKYQFVSILFTFPSCLCIGILAINLM